MSTWSTKVIYLYWARVYMATGVCLCILQLTAGNRICALHKIIRKEIRNLSRSNSFPVDILWGVSYKNDSPI